MCYRRHSWTLLASTSVKWVSSVSTVLIYGTLFYLVYYDALLSLTNNMFCAKSSKGADTLAGDSGGPLLCENNRGDWTLYGITSWGLTGEDKYPGVYTSVVEFMPWIGNVLDGQIEPTDNTDVDREMMGAPATIIEVWAPFPFFK